MIRNQKNTEEAENQNTQSQWNFVSGHCLFFGPSYPPKHLLPHTSVTRSSLYSPCERMLSHRHLIPWSLLCRVASGALINLDTRFLLLMCCWFGSSNLPLLIYALFQTCLIKFAQSTEIVPTCVCTCAHALSSADSYFCGTGYYAVLCMFVPFSLSHRRSLIIISLLLPSTYLLEFINIWVLGDVKSMYTWSQTPLLGILFIQHT